MKIKIYIIGSMSKYSNFNFPAFIKAENYLKKQGYIVYSPRLISLQLKKILKMPLSMIPRELFIKKDLFYLSQADGVYILKDHDSEGCKDELYNVNKMKLFKLYERN
jgi:hypothetical protein